MERNSFFRFGLKLTALGQMPGIPESVQFSLPQRTCGLAGNSWEGVPGRGQQKPERLGASGELAACNPAGRVLHGSKRRGVGLAKCVTAGHGRLALLLMRVPFVVEA